MVEVGQATVEYQKTYNERLLIMKRDIVLLYLHEILSCSVSPIYRYHSSWIERRGLAPTHSSSPGTDRLSFHSPPTTRQLSGTV